MFKGLLCSLLILISSFVFGQDNLTAFRKGVIVFTSGDSAKAEFSINLTNDLIQVMEGGALKTYSARQITSFYYIEPENNYTRFFFTYYYNEGRGYGYPKLFEVLYVGPHLTLLTRESIITESVPMYDGFSGRSMLTTRQRVQTDYYLVTPNTNPERKPNVVRYKFSKKQLFKICKDRAKEMKAFYKEQDLSYANKASLLKFVDYYNALKQGTTNGKETPDSSK